MPRNAFSDCLHAMIVAIGNKTKKPNSDMSVSNHELLPTNTPSIISDGDFDHISTRTQYFSVSPNPVSVTPSYPVFASSPFAPPGLGNQPISPSLIDTQLVDLPLPMPLSSPPPQVSRTHLPTVLTSSRPPPVTIVLPSLAHHPPQPPSRSISAGNSITPNKLVPFSHILSDNKRRHPHAPSMVSMLNPLREHIPFRAWACLPVRHLGKPNTYSYTGFGKASPSANTPCVALPSPRYSTSVLTVPVRSRKYCDTATRSLRTSVNKDAYLGHVVTHCVHCRRDTVTKKHLSLGVRRLVLPPGLYDFDDDGDEDDEDEDEDEELSNPRCRIRRNHRLALTEHRSMEGTMFLDFELQALKVNSSDKKYIEDALIRVPSIYDFEAAEDEVFMDSRDLF